MRTKESKYHFCDFFGLIYLIEIVQFVKYDSLLINE